MMPSRPDNRNRFRRRLLEYIIRKLGATKQNEKTIESVRSSYSGPHDKPAIGYCNSGKTTYLRQVAYTQILAQIGAPVPADFASVRITDQIFYHCSGADDLVSNESSFTREMKEMSYILRHATSASLILVDGLCQNTSLSEAVGLGWAICEALLEKKAFTFIATQCTELTQLTSISDRVETCHFLVRENPSVLETTCLESGINESMSSVQSAREDGGGLRVQSTTVAENHREWSEPVFMYKLLKGTAKRQPYVPGIQTARLTVLPEEVIMRAEDVFSKLTHTMDKKPQEFGVNTIVSTPVQSSIAELRLPSTVPNPTHSCTNPSGKTPFEASIDNCRLGEPRTAYQVEEASAANKEKRRESNVLSGDHTTERLKVRLLRQLSMLSMVLRGSDVENDNIASRSMEQKILLYLQFLQARYKAIISPNFEE